MSCLKQTYCGWKPKLSRHPKPIEILKLFFSRIVSTSGSRDWPWIQFLFQTRIQEIKEILLTMTVPWMHYKALPGNVSFLKECCQCVILRHQGRKVFCFDRVRPSVYDFLSSFTNLLPCGTEGDQDFDSNPVTTFCFIPRSPLTWSSSEMCGNLNDDIVSAVFHGFSSSVPNRAWRRWREAQHNYY